MISPQSSVEPKAEVPLHLHVTTDLCPWCEQPIPHDKFEEIKSRIEAGERSRAAEAEQRLRASFAAEKAQVELRAKTELDEARRESLAVEERLTREAEAREVLARQEGRIQAESAASEAAVVEQRRMQQETETLQGSLKTAEAKAVTLERERGDWAAKLAELADTAIEREAAAREEGRLAAEAIASESVLAERTKAEQDKRALQEELQVAALAKMTLELEREQTAIRLAELTATVASREQAALEEGKRTAESNAAAVVQAARDAQAVAERNLHALRIGKEAELRTRLDEQREVLEKDKTDAVNAERSHAFGEKLKLEAKFLEVQRQLQHQTPGDLGEGAEVNLFEMLKAHFPNDHIARVPKGVSGADILHKVIHNGKTCGSIIYESKNRGDWRHEYATKFRQDQLAAKADHAVLATLHFPANVRQLHIREGVILTNPARAAAVAQILRKQLVELHRLRLSSEARVEKTSRLYEFIVSDRCTQLLDRINTATDGLEDMDVKEVKAHEATWKKRGELIRSLQKYHADFSLEIDRILGTSQGGRTR